MPRFRVKQMVDNRGLAGIWSSLQAGDADPHHHAFRWHLLLCMLTGWSAGAAAAYALQRQSHCLGTGSNGGPLWLAVTLGLLLGRLLPPPFTLSLRRQWTRLPLLLLVCLGLLWLLPGWLSGVDWLALSLLAVNDLSRSSWLAVGTYGLLGGAPIGWLAGLVLGQLERCQERLSHRPFSPALPIWLFALFFSSAYLTSLNRWGLFPPTYPWQATALVSLLPALALGLLLYWQLVSQEDPDESVHAPPSWPPVLSLFALSPLLFFSGKPVVEQTIAWQPIEPPYPSASSQWYRWVIPQSDNFPISLSSHLARFGWEKIRHLHLLAAPPSVILLQFHLPETEAEADLQLLYRFLATLEPEFPCLLLFRGASESEYQLLLAREWENIAFTDTACPEDSPVLQFWSRLLAGKQEIAHWIDHQPLQFSALFAAAETRNASGLRLSLLRETFHPTPCQLDWVGAQAVSCLDSIQDGQKRLADQSIDATIAQWQSRFAALLEGNNHEQALSLYLRGVAFLPEEKRAPLYSGLAHLYQLSGRTDLSRKYEEEVLRLGAMHPLPVGP